MSEAPTRILDTGWRDLLRYRTLLAIEELSR